MVNWNLLMNHYADPAQDKQIRPSLARRNEPHILTKGGDLKMEAEHSA